jgi:hypothetical protein
MVCVVPAGGGAAGGLSADDLRAALRSAEDEDDAAAAAVAEKEAEAEMDEFTAEPPPEELKDDDLEGLEGDDAPSRMGESHACVLVQWSLLRIRCFSWIWCLSATAIGTWCICAAGKCRLPAVCVVMRLCCRCALHIYTVCLASRTIFADSCPSFCAVCLPFPPGLVDSAALQEAARAQAPLRAPAQQHLPHHPPAAAEAGAASTQPAGSLQQQLARVTARAQAAHLTHLQMEGVTMGSVGRRVTAIRRGLLRSRRRTLKRRQGMP